MHSILHKIIIEAAPDKLMDALATEAGLSAWWTAAKVDGNTIRFHFGPNGDHVVEMAVNSSTADNVVSWTCTDGPWADKGEFVFVVEPHERGASVDFAHHGWQESDDFFKHCNAKWGFFLVVSLKQYLETGAGVPHPNEPSI